ncbi:twin-arginine translocase TatA/TatE family subunit [Candidatus Leptofilum sp.]|uniref:twin-arginine translocase TatA/TatE family subunit n=1 Tax=Candidatus Leptofilum sp. TaxID=3241576 RepID=UPI003B5AF0AA
MDSFFGIGFPELVLILVVAGIVMGPERIGQAARWLGRTTAQLQKISRGFVRQLNHELDNSGDGEAIRETMQELQQLRKELTDLRGEVNQTTSQATQDGKQAFEEINNSIQPPNLKPPTLTPPPAVDPTTNGKPAASPEQSGIAAEEPGETAVPPRLPSLLDVPDDPE